MSQLLKTRRYEAFKGFAHSGNHYTPPTSVYNIVYIVMSLQRSKYISITEDIICFHVLAEISVRFALLPLVCCYAPAKHVAAFTTIKITGPVSTSSVIYSYIAFRFCGLTRRLHLIGPTRLVVYIIIRGFKGRVFLTSTTASSRHDGVTCGTYWRILSLRTSSRIRSGTDPSSVEELCRRIEIPSADTVLYVGPTPTWTRLSAPPPLSSDHSGASQWGICFQERPWEQRAHRRPRHRKLAESSLQIKDAPPTPPILIPALRDQAILTQLIDQV